MAIFRVVVLRAATICLDFSSQTAEAQWLSPYSPAIHTIVQCSVDGSLTYSHVSV